MPIETDLSVAPYHDDFDADKGFAQVLFKPGVSIQVRELNQLQTILSNQIERFGDNIFERGTIIDGCSFNFIESYPYAKILDAELDFSPADPGSYVGMFVRNSANLQAFVIDHADGFETATPDMKTIYMSYTNSGDAKNVFSYSPGDVLTIFDGRVGVHGVDVNSAGVGFSNTDRLIFVPSVVVNASSGTFTNGSFVTQPSTGANLQIYWVDDVSLAGAGQVILGLKARSDDLANASSNSSTWAVANTDTIRTSTNSAVGTVERVIGVNASGVIRTDGSGRVSNVTITNRGSGYTSIPYVAVFSPNNTSGVASLDLNAKNYAGKVTIAGGVASVGNGYAFSISEGVVYSKGYFLKVEAQTVVVSKYDQTPDGVVTGFKVDETIVTAQQDTSLKDNVIGGNAGAPGADRLKLTPRLEVANKADISPESDFFTLVGWSEGKPYRQNPRTVYSDIGDEMARRTSEESGDYVIDKFLISSKSNANQALMAAKVDAVIDPGTAYVSGYRVNTSKNYSVTIDTSRETKVIPNQVTSLSYGSWIMIKEVGGLFQYATADTVDLYDTPRTFLTTFVSNTSLVATGNKIGVARIRNMTYVNGTPGTAAAQHRLYLFDIRMSAGKNFRDVRSVYYNGVRKGVADVVLDIDSLGNNICRLRDSDVGGLVFTAGVESLKNVTGASYSYRTIFQDASFANNGTLAKSLASTPSEFFTQSGAWGDQLLQSLYVVPVGGDLIASNNLTGTVSVNATSANVTGTSTDFGTSLRAGDFLTLTGNSTQNSVAQVLKVVNNTSLVLNSIPTFVNATATIKRTFPLNVPIPFGIREGLTGNVDSNGNILTLSLGMSLNGSTGVNTALGTSVDRREIGAGTKVASRDRFVKIAIANNSGGQVGPWSIGIPDAFRLKGVWIGTDSSVSTTSPDVTGDFYIDINHSREYVDLGWLFLRPDSKLALSSSTWLLVKFDHFSVSVPGFYATPSYVSANSAQILSVDSTPLANLGTQVSSWEIPEVYTVSGDVYDLRASYDFRPIVSNTVASITVAASAPVNPPATISFGNTASTANDKKFPIPMSVMVADAEAYKGRVDTVVVGVDSEVTVLRGGPGMTVQELVIPNAPRDSMKLGILVVPPYPSIPESPSPVLDEILNMHRGNEKYEFDRLEKRTVKNPIGTALSQQTEGYTMAEIGQLSRRVKALEYQVSLTQLETEINNLVIPSSSDPTVDRFKFGFVADSFANTQALDTSNPQFCAMVVYDCLSPLVTLWNIDYGSGVTATSSFVDFPLVDQNYATYTPIEGETDCIEDGTVTNNYLIHFQANENDKGRSGFAFGDYIDVESITVSNTASPMSLFFHNYTYGDFIQVYQGNTIIANTAGAVALTDADKSNLTNTPELKPWFGSITFEPLVIENTRFAKGSGKLTWTHDPAQGRTYTVVTAKGTNSGRWRWALQYPVGTGLLSCPTQPTTTPVLYAGSLAKYVPPPSPPSYSGGGGGGGGGGLDAIDILYLNTLGRLPDPGGKAFWQGFADSHSNESFFQNFVNQASQEQGNPVNGGTTSIGNGPGAAGTNALLDAIRNM